MKTEIKFTRFIVITLALIAIGNEVVNSQGTDSRRTYTNRGKLYMGISIIPQSTVLKNEGFSTYMLNSERSFSVNFIIEGGYFFSKYAGITIGAGMNSYSGKISLDAYSTNYTTMDSENESYEMRISGNTINENQKVSFVSIPVCINLRTAAGKKLGFYVKGGIDLNIPIAKSYDGSGVFSYDGYYPAYPVLLQDLPAYGFPSNLNTSTSGSLQIKSLSLGLAASGGASFYINDLIQLNLGLSFNNSLGNISGYESDPDYKLTSKANELNSIMEGSTAAKIQAFGVSIGFRYYLK